MTSTITPDLSATARIGVLRGGISVAVEALGTGRNRSGVLRPEATVVVSKRGSDAVPARFVVGDYDGLACFGLDRSEQYDGGSAVFADGLSEEEYDRVDEFLGDLLRQVEKRMETAAREVVQHESTLATVMDTLDLTRMAQRAANAALGDSNDAEIARLRDALDMALGMLGMEMPEGEG